MKRQELTQEQKEMRREWRRLRAKTCGEVFENYACHLQPRHIGPHQFKIVWEKCASCGKIGRIHDV